MIGPNTRPDAVDRASGHLKTAKEQTAFRQGYIAHQADSQAQKREQRRYEIARDVLAALAQEAQNQDEQWVVTAREAILAADILLEQLEVRS